MITTKKYFLLFSLLCTVAFTSAQVDNRQSEADFQIQARFIEAGGLFTKGKTDEAIAIYKELLKAPEAVGAVQFELSRIYDAKDENDAAVKAAKAAVAAESTNEWYQKQLGDLYQKIGDDKMAAATYATLISLKPNNAYYYYKQAYFLVRANEPSKALKIYEVLEERVGINEELSRRKHTLFLGLGDKKKAEREIVKLIEVYPLELDYRHFLAGFYESNGEKGKAKKVYEYILTKNPNDTEAMVALAEDKKPNGGDADYIESLKVPFNNPELAIDAKIAQIIPLIQQVANENNSVLADQLLELSTIMEEVHDDAKAYSIAGDLYYYTGRKEEAIEKYEQTIQRNETILLVWEQYLNSLNETKNWKKLLARSEDALDVFPNQGSIHLSNAIARGRTGKHAEAIGALQQANMMSFNNPQLQYDIFVEMGEQYHYLNKYTESNESFQKAIEMNKTGTEGLARYAYFIGLQNTISKEELFIRGLKPMAIDIGEAEKMAAKVNEIAPSNTAYEAAYAMVFYAKKDYKNALDWYSKATTNMKYADPVVLEDYGNALLQSGDVENAVIQWKKALQAGGKATRLNKKIAEKAL